MRFLRIPRAATTQPRAFRHSRLIPPAVATRLTDFRRSGFDNTATGALTLQNNTIGQLNTANGATALILNTTGSNNTADGAAALEANTTGSDNTALGFAALQANSTGENNTAIGDQALLNNTTAGNNTATGHIALVSNTTGSGNTADGYQALASNVAGNGNTAVGYGALDTQTSGDFNVGVGLFAGNGVITATNVISIGTSGANVNDSCYIGNIWMQPGGSQAVYVNSDGKLGAQVSSRRFKEDIHPMEEASATLYGLKPVTFRYKKEIDRRGTQQLGLVAEEVAIVNPDLVIPDKQGKPYSVRYDQVNAMLLNEFLKEHRAFVEEQRKVADQQKEIDALKEELKEQRYLIQKVTDKIDVNQSTTRIARRDP